MKRPVTILSAAVAALLAWATTAAAGDPARVLFRQSFEDRESVERAGGRLVGGDLVPGRQGRALRIDRGTAITFPTSPSHRGDEQLPAQNLDFRQGTIEFWHRPDYQPQGGLRRVLFAAAGALDVDALVLEVTLHGELLAHRSWGRRQVYITAAAPAAWERGDWVHIAMTWASPDGEATAPRIYLQGEPVGGGKPEFGSFMPRATAGVELDLPLPPVLAAPDFDLCHMAGAYHATGLLDEVVIYGGELPAAEIRRLPARE